MNKFLTLLFFVLIGNHLVAQEFNLSFENLDTISNGRISPTNWKYLGEQLLSADSHHGKHAIRINSYYGYYHTNFYLTKQDIIPIQDLSGIGVPFSQRLTKLTGWYKYQGIQPNRINYDSAQVVVFLRKYLKDENRSVIVGQGEQKLGGADQYKEFSVPVKLLYDIQPDTLLVIFSTAIQRELDPKGGIAKLLDSPPSCSRETNGRCLYLTIDDLSLQFTTPTKNPVVPLQKLQINPNPIHDQAIVTWDVPDQAKLFNLNITDALGRTVRNIQTEQNQAEINMKDLPKGVYFVYLRQGAQLIGVERLVVAK